MDRVCKQYGQNKSSKAWMCAEIGRNLLDLLAVADVDMSSEDVKPRTDVPVAARQRAPAKREHVIAKLVNELLLDLGRELPRKRDVHKVHVRNEGSCPERRHLLVWIGGIHDG